MCHGVGMLVADREGAGCEAREMVLGVILGRYILEIKGLHCLTSNFLGLDFNL